MEGVRWNTVAAFGRGCSAEPTLRTRNFVALPTRSESHTRVPTHGSGALCEILREAVGDTGRFLFRRCESHVKVVTVRRARSLGPTAALPLFKRLWPSHEIVGGALTRRCFAVSQRYLVEKLPRPSCKMGRRSMPTTSGLGQRLPDGVTHPVDVSGVHAAARVGLA